MFLSHFLSRGLLCSPNAESKGEEQAGMGRGFAWLAGGSPEAQPQALKRITSQGTRCDHHLETRLVKCKKNKPETQEEWAADLGASLRQSL